MQFCFANEGVIFRVIETQWDLLAVASGTIRKASNSILTDELWSEQGLILRGPRHIRDVLVGSNKPFWMSVAIETKAHRQTGDLINSAHLVHSTVATHATDSLVGMNGVIEVDEIRDVVHTIPRNGRPGKIASSHRFEQRALAPNLIMATHTQFRAGNAGRSRRCGGRMAIKAIDSIILDVMAMIEFDWLINRIELPSPAWRAHPNHRRGNGADDPEHAEPEHDAKCSIGPGTK
jgi:hypothetical protein